MKVFKGMAICALALSVFAIGAQNASAGQFSQLPAATQQQLLAGQQVNFTQHMDGSNWDAVTSYKLVKASPEEAAAVFTDYGDQSTFLHDCCNVDTTTVQVAAVNGDLKTQQVYYHLTLSWPANSEEYQLLETLSGGNGVYNVNWQKTGNLGRADSITGRAYFEAVGSETLFYYYNFTKMTATFSGSFGIPDRATQSVEQTALAIANHIEAMHNQGGAPLQAQIQRVRTALGQ